MSSNQQARPFFRLGSFRPMQTTPQPPPPAPAPQASIIRPQVPRFRTPATVTTSPQETVAAAPPRQIAPPAAPAAPAPPPTTEASPTVARPQTPAPTPAPSSTPAAPPPSPAIPRFRIPASQETAPAAPPRQVAPPAAPPRQVATPAAPAAPAPLSTTEIRPTVAQPEAPTVAQPEAPLTNPSPAPSATLAAKTTLPAIPRFRIPTSQTTPPQETVLVVRPPTTETRPTVSQPQVLITNPAPAPSPTPVVSTPPPTQPSIVAPPPPTVVAPLLRPPPTQPNLATSKPVSPQPRFVASTIPSSPTTKTETVMRPAVAAAVAAALSRAPPTQPNLTSKPLSPQPRFMASTIPSSPTPTTKTETVMRSSPQQAAAAPLSMSSPRLPTDKSLVRTSIQQSAAAPQPQTTTSVISESPARESSALGNPFIQKPHPEPSTTPTTTSPMRKVSLPSPESKKVLGSRSPPPSEPLPTPAPTSIVPERGHTPALSPRTGKMLTKTPPQSPRITPLSRPPSPLTLPPAQIKTEINHEPNMVPKDQTTVMTHERNGKPKAKPRVTDTYEFVETTYKYIGKDGEGKDVHEKKDEAGQSGSNVIRLVGENHGAIMELSPSHTKENGRGRKIGPEYGKGNEEESSNAKNNKSMAIQAPSLTAFMNSNVQGMNNSIVYNTSCTHNDPGVHLSFSRKPNGGYVKDHIMD